MRSTCCAKSFCSNSDQHSDAEEKENTQLFYPPLKGTEGAVETLTEPLSTIILAKRGGPSLLVVGKCVTHLQEELERGSKATKIIRELEGRLMRTG